jgi:hypothetical protein
MNRSATYQRVVWSAAMVLCLTSIGLSDAATARGRQDQRAVGQPTRGDGIMPIASVNIDVRLADSDDPLPVDRAADRFRDDLPVRHAYGTHRSDSAHGFSWEAPGLCHRPLYFEDVNLERYGYSRGVKQPLFSAAHFFGRVPMLPYLMTARPPSECIYPLGHYRPGSYAPYYRQGLPLNTAAGLAEGGIATGLFFLIP